MWLRSVCQHIFGWEGCCVGAPLVPIAAPTVRSMTRTGTFLRFGTTGALLAAASVLLSACTSSGTTDPATTTASGASTPTTAPSTAASASGDGTPIRLTIGGTTTTGHLNGSATAQSLLDRLPMTVHFDDYNDLEKVGEVRPGLSTDGAPDGADPEPGEIGYYSPEHNLVLYNGDVGYFAGIIRIGTYEGGVDLVAKQSGPFDVRIERAD
jgi:hypothetical protein